MGLLSLGTPLEWKDADKFGDHVRKHGIEVWPGATQANMM